MTRSSHEDLGEALGALRAEVDRLRPAARRGTQRALSREFAPAAQVGARLELSGGRVHGGVDLRGDGSAEAWTGRWRRTVVTPRGDEDAVAALARVLGTARHAS